MHTDITDDETCACPRCQPERVQLSHYTGRLFQWPDQPTRYRVVDVNGQYGYMDADTGVVVVPSNVTWLLDILQHQWWKTETL